MVGPGDGREGGKSVPRGGGRCHCVGGVNSYGTQILTKEGWWEIQDQGDSRKVTREGESRKNTKRGERRWLKTKTSNSLASKPGNSLQHG